MPDIIRNRSRHTDKGSGKHKVTLTFKGMPWSETESNRHLGVKTEGCYDTSHANWFRRIQMGQDVSGRMRYTKDDPVWPYGEYIHNNGPYEKRGSGVKINFCNFRIDTLPLRKDLRETLPLASCIAGMDNTPYQMMEDIFEIKSTLKLLRDPLHSMANLARKMKRRRAFYQKRWRYSRSKAISQAWLEYRFAWSPLYRSVNNLVESFHKEYEHPPRSTVRRYSRDSKTSKDFWVNNQGEHCVNKAFLDFEGNCGICYSVTNPVRGWRHELGLRAKDIPVTLWNILPLSFMVDRFINISDSIRALTNLVDPNVHIHYAWQTRQIEERWEAYTTQKDAGTNGFTGVHTDGGYFRTQFEYNRDPWYPTALDAVPVVELSGLVKSVTSTVDLFALIIQSLK